MSRGILDPDGKNPNPLTGNSYSARYLELSKHWRSLPAYEKATEIIKCIEENQVILITSGTGSGKTVLVPKFCLHALNYTGNIMVTLPKQIIAKKAAEFAADTLDVKLGEHVGYKYRGSDKRKRGSNPNILYATDGSVVAKLLEDPVLEKYNSVIIDEAHERKIQIDLLLFLLKKLLKKRPTFKVIIMSATIDSQIFESYYKSFRFEHINVSGKTNFHIESHFLPQPLKEDYIDKGVALIESIVKKDGGGDNSVIFFVPSISETLKVCQTLADKFPLLYCVSVYSGIKREQEELAQDKDLFRKMFPEKKKKVVITTNVAESSLTIDGAKYVIDCGYEIASSYDPEINSDIISKNFISKAQVKQRMGRTGRTGPGECFHLYTRQEFDKMPDYPLASILRSNLYNEIFKLFKLGKRMNSDTIIKMLSEFIEPPENRYVRKAIDSLIKLGLINSKKTLSSLGSVLLNKPVDPMEGCVLFYSQKLGCLKEVSVIVSMISASRGNMKDFFSVETQESLMPVLRKYQVKNSDHLTLLNIYNRYEQSNGIFNHSLFIKIKKNIRMIKGSFSARSRDRGSGSTKARDIVKSFYLGLTLNRALVNRDNKAVVRDNKKVVKVDSHSVFNGVKSKTEVVFSSMVKYSQDINISILSAYK